MNTHPSKRRRLDNGLPSRFRYLPRELVALTITFTDGSTWLKCRLVCQKWKGLADRDVQPTCIVRAIWRVYREVNMGCTGVGTITKRRHYLCALNLVDSAMLTNEARDLMRTRGISADLISTLKLVHYSKGSPREYLGDRNLGDGIWFDFVSPTRKFYGYLSPHERGRTYSKENCVVEIQRTGRSPTHPQATDDEVVRIIREFMQMKLHDNKRFMDECQEAWKCRFSE